MLFAYYSTFCYIKIQKANSQTKNCDISGVISLWCVYIFLRLWSFLAVYFWEIGKQKKNKFSTKSEHTNNSRSKKYSVSYLQYFKNEGSLGKKNSIPVLNYLFLHTFTILVRKGSVFISLNNPHERPF